MDVFENIFGRFSSRKKKRAEIEKNKTAAFLEDELNSVRILFGIYCSDSKIVPFTGDDLGSVSMDRLGLPARVAYFKDKSLNRKVYLHKALVAGVIQKRGLRYPNGCTTFKDKSYAIWNYRQSIQQEIRSRLPGYDDCFDELFVALEQKGLQRHSSDLEFIKWIQKAQPGYLHPKRIARFPTVALMPWCGLMAYDRVLVDPKGQPDSKRNRGQSKTEAEAKYVSEVEVIDLDKKKKQENPIMHSFETMHTADEYQGGYRVSDGSDEMKDHQNALDELQMGKLTRSKGEAGSIYRATIEGLYGFFQREPNQSTNLPSVMYPEWDYKLGAYKKDFCKLFLSDSSGTESNGNFTWKQKLVEKNQSNISRWRARIESIANQEVWQPRQWEGPEIDLNSYTCFCADLSSKVVRETPLYMKPCKRKVDTACLFLFDQSFSTDSWVQDKRVLDLELESIGIAGLLTKDLGTRVAVAGTWSQTRNQCHYHVYKDFDSQWERFYLTAANIEPMGYTRLGPSVRHSVEKLCGTKARRRILIILTDGKPTDYDRYEGRYGIEDVRSAVIHARNSGIYTKAIAVEKAAAAHFPLIFGEGGYVILNDVDKLPENLWKIFVEALK